MTLPTDPTASDPAPAPASPAHGAPPETDPQPGGPGVAPPGPMRPHNGGFGPTDRPLVVAEQPEPEPATAAPPHLQGQ